MTDKSQIPDSLYDFLLGSGLIANKSEPIIERLTGGVSSDIWKVTSGGRIFCVKRALSQLAVKDLWEASTERNAYEVEWFKTVAAFSPDVVPEVIAHDRQAGFFAMTFIDPEEYTVWKDLLSSGDINDQTAVALANALVKIHSETAYNDGIAKKFKTDDLFFDLRINAYLITAAKRNRDVRARIMEIADLTQKTKVALVHGDVSPKNIMANSAGDIVILDAETAWFGDPAFDVAFLLNHMLLKSVWKPEHTAKYNRLFDLISTNYLAGVDWEDRDGIETRIAHLLPMLLLARVDGKSPAEYVTEDAVKNLIRIFAKSHIKRKTKNLKSIGGHWAASSSLKYLTEKDFKLPEFIDEDS